MLQMDGVSALDWQSVSISAEHHTGNCMYAWLQVHAYGYHLKHQKSLQGARTRVVLDSLSRQSKPLANGYYTRHLECSLLENLLLVISAREPWVMQPSRTSFFNMYIDVCDEVFGGNKVNSNKYTTNKSRVYVTSMQP